MAFQSSAAPTQSTPAPHTREQSSSSSATSSPSQSSPSRALQSPSPCATAPSQLADDSAPGVPSLFLSSCNSIVSFPDALVLICGSSASSLGREEQCCKNPSLSPEDCIRLAHRIRSVASEYTNSAQGRCIKAPRWRSILGIIRLACLTFFLALSFLLSDPILAIIVWSLFVNLIVQDAIHSTTFAAYVRTQEHSNVYGNGVIISAEDEMLYVFDNPSILLHQVHISCVFCFRKTLVHWNLNRRQQQALNSQRSSYCVEVVTLGKTIFLGNCADEQSMDLLVQEANDRLQALRENGMVSQWTLANIYDDDNLYSALQLPVTSELVADQTLSRTQILNKNFKITRKENEWVEISWYHPGDIHYLPPKWRWLHIAILIVLISWPRVRHVPGYFSYHARMLTILYFVATLFPLNYNSISWRTFACSKRRFLYGLNVLACVLFRRHHLSAKELVSIAVNRSQVGRMRSMQSWYSSSAVSGRRFELEFRFRSGKTMVLRDLLAYEAFIIAKEVHTLFPLVTTGPSLRVGQVENEDRDVLLAGEEQN